MVNAAFLGISANGFTAGSLEGPANRWTALLVVTFAQGKFYLLFSFLFGYSASFLLRDHQRSHRRRYLRRMLALLGFGLAHAVGFFVGDILLTYAILGALLLSLSRCSDRALRRWTRVAIAVAVFLLLGLSSLAAIFPAESTGALPGLNRALATGSFVEASLARLEALPTVWVSMFLLQGPMAFAAFVVGLRASRRRLLADPGSDLEGWRSRARWGWRIGLPLQAIAAWMQVEAIAAGTPFSVGGAAGLALGFSTAPILTAGYVGSIATALSRRPNFLAWVTPAGRMSLTVYIGESTLLSLVFAAYGLGSFGQWKALPVVATGIASWGLLLVLAGWWRKHFARGPLEWVLAVLAGTRGSVDEAGGKSSLPGEFPGTGSG